MRKTGFVIMVALLVVNPLVAEEIDKRIEVEPGMLLEVDLETGGSLDVSGWDENAVLVQGRTNGKADEELEIVIEKSGEGVLIEIEGDDGWGWGRGRRSHSVDLEIKVPRVFDLDLETMGGDISVANVEGDLEGETMGGDLRLTKLTGELEFETMGGDIELTDSEVDGEIETMGGRVLVENVIGDVDGSSMGGNVIYKNVTRRSGETTGEAVVISTMGGDVEISSAPAGAKLETMGGDIEVGSAGRYVEAETMGGDIIIGTVEGWVVAETMGGDVEVTLVGDPQADDRDVKLSSMGGEIRLTVPRNFSMEVDIEIAYDSEDGRTPKIISDVPLETETTEGESRFWRRSGAELRGSGSFNGGRNKVEIETIGGDVHLKYAN